jgi:hypothetical protein
LHEAAFPNNGYGMAAAAGVDHIRFGYVIMSWGAAVKLVRRGYSTESVKQHQYSFRRLKQNKGKIEAAFGGELEWIPTEHTRNWHIVAPLDDVGGIRDSPHTDRLRLGGFSSRPKRTARDTPAERRRTGTSRFGLRPISAGRRSPKRLTGA